MKQLKSQAKQSYYDNLKQKSHFRSYTLQSDQESVVDKLNTSTVKILDEMLYAKSKLVELESDFQIRQKSYEIEKQKKILQMKEEQLRNEQMQSQGKPKINKTQQIQEMINNYMEASKNSKFGDLLLNKEKNMQQELTYNIRYENSNIHENNEPERIATQTLESTKMYNEQSVSRKSNSYIPIHERVKYIIQTKNDKIQEQKQQQQQEIEEYYSGLPFQPLSTKSQNIKFTQQDSEEFVSNQLKWNQQRDRKIYEQQLKKENDTPKYSYRPTISPWPVIQSSVQRKHSKSITVKKKKLQLFYLMKKCFLIKLFLQQRNVIPLIQSILQQNSQSKPMPFYLKNRFLESSIKLLRNDVILKNGIKIFLKQFKKFVFSYCNLSFLQSTAHKTEASPKKNKKSFVFQTDLRIAKRREKEQKKFQK